jgi:hypothetical protein
MYKDRRSEDYVFTKSEQGNQMNVERGTTAGSTTLGTIAKLCGIGANGIGCEVTEVKQVSRKAGELTVAVDYLEAQVDALGMVLDKVLPALKDDTCKAREEGLVPLAAHMDEETCRIADITWKIILIMNKLEL